MILSHEHGFVFIKTRKTAGTSIEIALSQICGSRDIITPISPEDESLRGLDPQNTTVPIRRLRPRDVYPVLRTGRRIRYFNHIPAQRVRRYLGQTRWDSYFTWSVERNPWDRAVSSYYWFLAQSNRPPIDFTTFLSGRPFWKLSNFHLYSDGEAVIVDRVIHFEFLSAGLVEVSLNIGVTIPSLPQAKAQFRPQSNRDFKSMYSDEDAELVARVCSHEIRLFGYSFDRREPATAGSAPV